MNHDKEMESRVEYLRTRLGGIQIHATPDLVSDLKIPAFGGMRPLSSIAEIRANYDRIVIRLYDRHTATTVERVIRVELGLVVTCKGDELMVFAPPPSEERRDELVKIARAWSEEERVKVRQIRRTAMDKAKAAGHSVKRIQESTDLNINAINVLLKNKETDIVGGKQKLRLR